MVVAMLQDGGMSVNIIAADSSGGSVIRHLGVPETLLGSGLLLIQPGHAGAFRGGGLQVLRKLPDPGAVFRKKEWGSQYDRQDKGSDEDGFERGHGCIGARFVGKAGLTVDFPRHWDFLTIPQMGAAEQDLALGHRRRGDEVDTEDDGTVRVAGVAFDADHWGAR